MISHIMNCLWIAFGYFSQELGGTSWLESHKTSTSQGTSPPEAQLSRLELYINGLYLIATTITTVGFGDYNATSNLEYLYGMFTQVLHTRFLKVTSND